MSNHAADQERYNQDLARQLDADAEAELEAAVERVGHTTDLEACYVRALDAMGKVQKLRDYAADGRWIGGNPWVVDRLDEILAAFQGK